MLVDPDWPIVKVLPLVPAKIMPPVPLILPISELLKAPVVIVALAKLFSAIARFVTVAEVPTVVAAVKIRPPLELKVSPPATAPRLVFAPMLSEPALMTTPPVKPDVVEERMIVLLPEITGVTAPPLSAIGALIVRPKAPPVIR